MIDPRWKKVLSDLWSNKTRTLLVAMSIAVGVFAVGMIFDARIRMLEGLSKGYLAGDPMSAAIMTVDAFDEDLLDAIRKIEGVDEADARKGVSVRLNVGPNQWENLYLTAISDFDDIRVGRMIPEEGQWPPPDEQLVIERSALNPVLGFEMDIGATLHIETLDQKRRDMRVAGIAHDLNQPPTFLFGTYFGYITEDTLEWLGETPREYNDLTFTVRRDRYFDQEYVVKVAREVREKIEKSGVEVGEVFIPPVPGESPVASFGLKPILQILSVVGILSVLLSGFLVTNTISGVLMQQMKQIGIMKAVGARSGQVILMYIVLVICFGVLAMVIGAPPAYFAARAFTAFFATLFNFDPISYGILPQVLLLEALVSIVVPVLASFFPLWRSARITVREAISTDSSAGSYGTSIVDRLINRVRGFPRPVLLSLRNTFRRKGRLTLTLITLTLAGAIFIAVFSVQDSVALSLDEIFDTMVKYDVQMQFDRAYRSDRIQVEALRVPGVVEAETWGVVGARRLRPNNTESDAIFLQGVPQDTTMIDPEIMEGRALLPDEQNALLISSGLQKEEKDLQVGETMILKIKGRETTWNIVGSFKGFGASLVAITNLQSFVVEAREAGDSTELRVRTEEHSKAYQSVIAQNMEKHFRSVGLRVSSSTTSASEYDQAVEQFNIIVYCLLIMAVLTAIVGGLGLAGTMSMNVLERTREIGIMRAIGASNLSIQQIVVVEGIMIGLLSWAIGVGLAFPISKVLSDTVGNLFTGSPFSYTYSIGGALIWLVLSLSLAIIASLLPAWNASRLTIREVLAYE
jgi:putative ABC transport system permease protein